MMIGDVAMNAGDDVDLLDGLKETLMGNASIPSAAWRIECYGIISLAVCQCRVFFQGKNAN